MLENINNCGILTSHNTIITEQYSKPIYFTYHIFYYCKCVYLKNEIPQTTFNKTLCTTSIQQVENTGLYRFLYWFNWLTSLSNLLFFFWLESYRFIVKRVKNLECSLCEI